MQWSGLGLVRKKLRNSLRNITRKVKMLDSVNSRRQSDRVLIRLRVTKKRVILEIAETLEIEEIIVSILSFFIIIVNYKNTTSYVCLWVRSR